MVTSVLSAHIAAVSVSRDIVDQALCLTLVLPLSDSARGDQLRDKVVNLRVGRAGAGLDHSLCGLGGPVTSDGGDGVNI